MPARAASGAQSECYTVHVGGKNSEVAVPRPSSFLASVSFSLSCVAMNRNHLAGVVTRPTVAFHEPDPLIPSFSPSGGEGARRAVEWDSEWFMGPMRDRRTVEATHEPGLVATDVSPWVCFAKPASPVGSRRQLRFMVREHGSGTKGAPHEPCPRRGVSAERRWLLFRRRAERCSANL